MKVTISRKAHFNAAHRLSGDWTWEQNDAILGENVIPIFMVITMNC
jgi:hypothetical protein